MAHSDLSPVTLLLQEVQSLTSSMRRNQRWAPGSSQGYSNAQPSIPPYLHASRKRRSLGLAAVSGGASSLVGDIPRRSKGPSGDVEEGDLMGGFVELRRSLSDTRDITSLSPLSLLSPFLALVRSPLTSGPITSLSLASIHTIILSVLPHYLAPPPREVAPSSPLQIGLAHLTAALSSCRFPSSSPQQDELVLLRLLRVIEALAAPLSHTAGASDGTCSMLDHMGDESVCELLEVGLGMLARARLSEGLRNTAQNCVQVIVRAAFRRLRTLTPDDVEKMLEAGKEAEAAREARAGRRNGARAVGKLEDAGTLEGDESRPTEDPSAHTANGEKVETERKSGEQEVASEHEQEEDDLPPTFTPYGLPTILELLRVLIALLNPTDQAHTDSMRLAALAVLNTALEVGGSSLGTWPELRDGVKDEGCRYLFQLTRSDTSPLLAQSLRTTSTLFSTLLPHLKLQLELFLSYLIDRLTPTTPPLLAHINHALPISRPGTPAAPSDSATAPSEAPTPTANTPKPLSLLPPVPSETRELMLETLTQLAQRPSFMVDCYVNFDCSTDSEDLFERMVAFLTRGVYPSAPPKVDREREGAGAADGTGLDGTQSLSLEILLGYVSSMADRHEQGADEWPTSPSTPSPETLVSRKERKGVLLQGATMFNQKPKNGIAFLEKNGIISVDASASGDQDEATRRAEAIARFLRSSARLDKKELGDYISRPDQEPLLRAFMRTFDFRGKSIADAMRELLETFRLPGEAQPIARITEMFAEVFFASEPPEIVDQDAVYVLAYSVIMLNTDLHNPQNRKRMTIDDYKRNVRGVNGGKDFDPEYLAAIHESIKKKEIILPEEHVGQPGFDYAWKSLILRTRTAGPMISCNTSVFDRAMFTLSWRSVVSAIAYAFTTSAQDEHVIQKAITGFRQCALLAGHFDLPEVFDTIVQSLAGATGLLDDSSDQDGYPSLTNYNFPTVDKDGQSLVVSPLSVRFGQSYRAQLATVVLFTITNGHASALRDGWMYVVEMLQTLFAYSLLPARMLQMEDFLAGQTMIPMTSALATGAGGAGAGSGAGAAGGGGGLLSALSSYLLSPYGSSQDHLAQVECSEDDVESTLVAADCLESCRIEELYAEILALGPDALIPALTAIRSLAEARSTARLTRRGASTERGETGSPRSVSFEGQQLSYDPACVFLLEMLVSVACRNADSVSETWPLVFEYLSAILSSAQQYSVLLVERAVVGLLRMCLLIADSPELRDQLYIALDVLRSLPSSVLGAVSEQLMAGIAKIIEKDSTVVRSQTEWGLIIALFRATVNHPEASKVTLDIVQKMVNQQGPAVTVDNWTGVIALLDEFATAAGWASARRAPAPRRSGGNAGATQTQTQAHVPVVERGLAALDSGYELQKLLPGLSERVPGADVWSTLWFPLLAVLSKHCVNPVREIRQRALGYLQRTLVSPALLTGTPGEANTLPLVFEKILFPIMDELLKPATLERDPAGVQETRLKAATLLSKVFLQYHVLMAHADVEVLFGRMLERLEKFMRGERDTLNEAGESLKNLVLVMHSSGLLVPPPPPLSSAPQAEGVQGESQDGASTIPADGRTEEQRTFWVSVAASIERVLPGFVRDVLGA